MRSRDRRLALLEKRLRQHGTTAEEMTDAELWRRAFPDWRGPMPDDEEMLRLLDERAANDDKGVRHAEP